jgi:RNA polymerase sigma-70 factor (ECF subfamily)
MRKGPSDEEMMKQCREGDAAAFEVLFRRHKKAVISFVFRMTGDLEASEDIFQTSFLQVFKERRKYLYPKSFTTWLYTITRNQTVNFIKRRRAGPVAQGGRAGWAAEVVEDRKQPTPLRAAEEGELHERLSRAVDSLPLEEREVLILREYQKLQYKEISKVVGVPEGTLRYRMHCALNKLRAFFPSSL